MKRALSRILQMNKLSITTTKRILVTLLICTIAVSQSNVTLGQQQQFGPLGIELGFSDPTILKLEEGGMDTIGENIEFNANDYQYRLISVLPHSVATNDGPVNDGGAILLYAMNDIPTLIWHRALNGEYPMLGRDSGALPSPGYWNSQKDVFFAFSLSTNTSNWNSYLVYIYQLNSNNTVYSPLSVSIPPGHIVTSIQIEQDQNVLLLVDDIRWQGAMGISVCCGPRIQHFFEWQNDRFVDVSAKHVDVYFEKIGLLLYTLTTWQFSSSDEQMIRLYCKDLFELLMIYDILGHREKGWALVKNLIEQKKNARELDEDTYVDKVFLPEITRSYNTASPFALPETQSYNLAIYYPSISE